MVLNLLTLKAVYINILNYFKLVNKKFGFTETQPLGLMYFNVCTLLHGLVLVYSMWLRFSCN